MKEFIEITALIVEAYDLVSSPGLSVITVVKLFLAIANFIRIMFAYCPEMVTNIPL